MKQVVKLINGDLIFGKLSAEADGKINIQDPYTITNGAVHPYMLNVIGDGLKFVVIHPMNVLWTVPMEDVEKINKIYDEALSGIVTDTKPKIEL